MSQKKYVSLSKLSTFLDNLSTKFAALVHKHTISDLTDYTVDTELSSTSTNPVQNKVLDAEFDAISASMQALESAIDDKADVTHNHNDLYYTKSQVDALSVGEHTHESDSVIYTDTITGAQYNLYVTDGKLNMVRDGEIPQSQYPNGDEVTY